MSARCLVSRSILLALVAATFVLLDPVDSHALSRVRREIWSYQGDIPTSPGETVVDVSFFASVGDMDLPSRIVFAITILDDADQEHTLLRYRWGTWENLPDPGTPVQVFMSFAMSCDGRGLITARPLATTFAFCNLGQANPEERSIDNFETFEVQTSGSFGLVIVDRGGYRGDTPTPPDAFSCVGSFTHGLTESQALEELREKKNEWANRLNDDPPGSIGIYFDREGTQCSGTIAPGQPVKVYVVARMEGLSECGIAGAEFRFTGIPDAWMTHAVPNPEIVALGDPLLEGTAIGFQCKRPEDGSSVLYEIDVVADEMVNDVQFQIEPRNPPANPNFACPLLVLCDRPIYTKVCVSGFECFVNPTKALPDRCAAPVAVEDMTWTRVKSLFR